MSTEAASGGATTEDLGESDDFGSFSDASFENEIVQQGDVDSYLEKLLPSDTCRSEAKTGNGEVMGLLDEERPRIIYEQLVQLRTVLQPFNWDKSHLKADLWHILRLPENVAKDQLPVRERALDDSLYRKLRAMLEDKHVETATVLRDQCKFDYSVPLAPGSLQFEDEDDIPELLEQSEEDVEDWQSYHDQLCHAVDVLFGKLRKLQEQQRGLLSDKNTFEDVVLNLTGHTQRLYRDQVALYNKKLKKKNKFSWRR